MSHKRKDPKDVIVAQVHLPKSALTPEKLSEILGKLGEGESVELFQSGRIEFHRRKATGGKEIIPLKNSLFVGLETQHHINPGRAVLPIDGGYDYADRHAKTRKEANRNEKIQQGAFTGARIQLMLENVEPTLFELHFSTYWMFTLESGTKVFTEVGNKDKIVMIKRPGEDYQYNPD